MGKWFASLGVVLLGVGSALWAQEKVDSPQGQRERARRVEYLLTFLMDTLKLTGEQQEKLKPLLENHVARAQEIRRSESDKRKRHEKLRDLRQQTDAAIGDLLTAEQRAIWDKIKADWRRRAKARWEKRTGQRLLEED